MPVTVSRLFALELAALPGLLTGLHRVAAGHLFVPGRMERPGPGFADRTPKHRLESSWLADSAEINVNEDAAEHDHGGNVVQDVADRNRPASKSSSTRPQHDPGEYKNHASDNDLPELRLLSGI